MVIANNWLGRPPNAYTVIRGGKRRPHHGPGKDHQRKDALVTGQRDSQWHQRHQECAASYDRFTTKTEDLLFPDAEPAEDLPEQVVRGELAGQGP